MKDRIFTDDEIIKALKCCSSYDCDGCPLYSPTINCVIELPKKALELAERYRAENERLKEKNERLTEMLQEGEE